MKILWCKKCRSMFNLHSESKSCECGKSHGRYIDDINAIYTGKYAILLGIDNHSFFARLLPKCHVPHNIIYDEWHGKGNIQCWIIDKKTCTTIKKLSLTEYNTYGEKHKELHEQTASQ